MIQILQAIKELLLITLAFFKQHNQILQLINFSSFILTFCLLLLINIPSIIFIFISLILLFKEFIIKMIIIAIDIIIYIISHWKEIKQILLNIGIDICSLIMIAIMSLGFSLDVYMKNANAKNDIEFIV